MCLVSQRELCMALGTVVQMEPRSVMARLSRKKNMGVCSWWLQATALMMRPLAQEGSQGDAQEEAEVQELQLPCVCQCQQEEVADGAAVGHFITLAMESC
ncbi:hypothetical protein DUI87_26038 [Hirundo rustica rustica]|uniref:Uncharacterized protein n=1 Tax=Hirundo rustica rustica TaxID=333673 RepID=A0A3M0J8D8_HIRRU|nr:hypothetical protein DUI87_26038 [Hirundo rustica rustica]